MPRVLIVDKKSSYQAGMIRLLEKNGHNTVVATTLEDAIHSMRQEPIPIAVLGSEFDGLQAADVIPALKAENLKLVIVLVADDLTPSSERRIRQAGIFYHALRPSRREDTREILQAVNCAVDSLKPKSLPPAEQGPDQLLKTSTPLNAKGVRHENEKTAIRNNDLSTSFRNPCAGSTSGSRRSQRHSGLGISRFLRINRHGSTRASAVDDVRHAQRTCDFQEQGSGSDDQVITRPLLQLIIMEVVMTRWIILGGAVVLASGLTTLATFVPEFFHGFNGIVIWMFLGFCSIIVVAQLWSAVNALLVLTQKPFAQVIEQLVRGGKS